MRSATLSHKRSGYSASASVAKSHLPLFRVTPHGRWVCPPRQEPMRSLSSGTLVRHLEPFLRLAPWLHASKSQSNTPGKSAVLATQGHHQNQLLTGFSMENKAPSDTHQSTTLATSS